MFQYLKAVHTRACLKKAFCKMCVTICGRFRSDEGAVAGYATDSGKIYRKVGASHDWTGIEFFKHALPQISHCYCLGLSK